MKHFLCAALVAASVSWAGTASAVPISGSLSFSDGANETGQSLLTRTSFTVLNATTQGGTGNFGSVALNLPVTIGTFSLPAGAAPTAVGVPSDFQFSFSGGTFTAKASQKIAETVSATGNESITATFFGTFQPAGSLAGFGASTADVIANLNRSGSVGGFSVASAFTLATSPSDNATVPEPASMMVLGAGLVALGATRRRAR